MTTNSKIETLCEIEGYEDPVEMMEDLICDSVHPGICTNDGCDYTNWVEPDQTRGWCDECQGNSVVSAGILMGIV